MNPDVDMNQDDEQITPEEARDNAIFWLHRREVYTPSLYCGGEDDLEEVSDE